MWHPDLGPKTSLPRVAPLALCALNSPHPVSSLTPPSFIYHGWTKSSFLHLPERRLIEGGNKDIQQNQVAGPWATGQTSEESYNPTWPPVCSPLEECHYGAQSAVCIKQPNSSVPSLRKNWGPREASDLLPSGV